MEKLANELGISTVELLGLQEAKSEEVIRKFAMISQEEKEEIKKGIRFRSKMTIFCVAYLIFAEIYLSYELHKIGLQGGIYGVFTIGLLGILGTILGCALYKYRVSYQTSGNPEGFLSSTSPFPSPAHE